MRAIHANVGMQGTLQKLHCKIKTKDKYRKINRGQRAEKLSP